MDQKPLSGAFRAEFKAAAAAFVFAGFVGVWMRYAQFFGGFGELNFVNVRHAHSHLMLWTWAVPAVLIVLGERFHATARVGFRRSLRATLGLGLLSFVPFFHWGYQPARWGEIKLPISIVISTLIIFVWYWVVVAYIKRRKGLTDQARGGWDLVMLNLVLCTIGAWARAVFTALKMGDTIWADGAVQLFLTLFTDGVLVLGVVVAMAHDKVELTRMSRWAMSLGLPVAFMAHLPGVHQHLRLLGIVGSFIFLIGLLSALYQVRGTQIHRAWWAAVIITSARLFYLIPEVGAAFDRAGFRVFALHWIFLGVVSLGALELRGVGARWLWGFTGAVALLLVGILATTVGGGMARAIGSYVTLITAAMPACVLLGWLVMQRPQESYGQSF